MSFIAESCFITWVCHDLLIYSPAGGCLDCFLFEIIEIEQDPGVGNGQGSLVCCSPRSHKELDITQLILVSNFYFFKTGHFMSLLIV